MLPGLCKLGCASNSAKPFFGSLSGARRRDNGENQERLTPFQFMEGTMTKPKLTSTVKAAG